MAPLFRSRFFRWLCFLLLGMSLTLLPSCFGPPPTTGPQIEFWTMQLKPKFTDYFNQLIATFEQDHPGVKVRWVDVPWTAMQSKILTAVSARTAPDVVNLNPDFASQLAARKAWLDLNGRVTAAQQAEYLPKIWDALTLNGQSFGLPWYLTSRITISNQELLTQAGISQPPQTFAELAQAARQIKAKTGKYAFFITVVPEDSAELIESLVQMGVELVDSQGKAAFNSPAGQAAVQFWVDLYQQDLLPPQILTEGHRQGIELYQAGQTAILLSSPEFLNTVEINAPSIAKVSVSSPQITGETGKKNVAAMNMVIPKDTKEPELAVKFALFVTNNQNQLDFAKAANVLPSTVAALEDPYFTNLPADATPIQIARAVSAKQMNQAAILIPAVKDVKQLQKALYENIQAAMLKQKTVEQALADAAQAWDSRVNAS